MTNSIFRLILLSGLACFQASSQNANQSLTSTDGGSKMLAEFKKSYSRQVGASLKMLENAILKADDKTWTARINNMPFWQICYHVLWYTDFYFHADQETFKPQSFDVQGLKDIQYKPDSLHVEMLKHPLSKSDMLLYHNYVKQKSFEFIQGINESYFTTPSPFEWHGFPMIDIVDYNLRHLQHHVAYLDIIIRREQNMGSPWVMHAQMPD
jgi:hypothetical protein